jgi:anti-sigma B factor antagonist
MEPAVEKVGDVTIVAVNVVELDAASADTLRRDIAPVLKDCRNLVLDLERIQFIDSRGCGAILSCLKHVSAVGGDLKLCRVSPPVLKVFELIRMHSICQIVDTKEEAVQAFQKSKKGKKT